jgi:nucleotide-binding universal stress UspA family protein
MTTNIRTIVAAVDDSPASLAAASLALEVGRATGATVHAVAVAIPEAEPLAAGHPDPDGEHTARTVLRYVAHLAATAGCPLVTAQRTGPVAAQVLQYARDVGADVIVVGRSARHGIGEPYVGSQARHVLEFAECAVIVVPPPPLGPEWTQRLAT